MRTAALALRVAFLLCAPLWVTAADAAARFAVCTTTCTWDNSSTAMWSTTSGGGTGASAPGSGDDVTLDAATCVGGTTCTITVNANLTIQSLTMGAFTASTAGGILDFSVNNNTVSVLTVTLSGTGTRSLKCGSGTWTLTGTGSVWNNITTTNETLTCSATPITLTATTASVRNFFGGSQSYGAWTVSTNSSRGYVNLTGANTFASWSIAAGTYLSMPISATNTITAAPTLTGTASLPITINSGAAGVSATISVASGTFSCVFCATFFMAYTGGATFSFTNSFDQGSNTGATITGPTTGGGGGRIIGG